MRWLASGAFFDLGTKVPHGKGPSLVEFLQNKPGSGKFDF